MKKTLGIFLLCELFFSFIVLSPASALFKPLIKDEVNVSTPPAGNVLSGRIMPPELKITSWKKYNYEAGIGLFGERHKAYPAVFVLAGKEKNTIGLSYLNSSLPFIKNEYDFLRSNDIAVNRITSQVPIKNDSGAIIGTSTFITDEISQFHSRTQILDFFYARDIITGNEKYKLSFITGIPIGYNSYSLRCTLDNGSSYSESGASFGTGLIVGLKFSAANSLLLNKGLVFSAGAIYRKLWFKNITGKMDSPLREEISGIRIFLNTAWRFNFYN